MSLSDDQIIERLATARFGSAYVEDKSAPRLRTMRENVEWALPEVKKMMEKAYEEGQYAGFEDCYNESEDRSPNPYEEEA